ncbi:MAG: hypothetical protein C7B46_14605, partial [Sulfobacillus benefaciens]
GGGKILAADGREGFVECALIPFDLHHIMRLFLLHQVAGRVLLRMESVDGDDVPLSTENVSTAEDVSDTSGGAVRGLPRRRIIINCTCYLPFCGPSVL